MKIAVLCFAMGVALQGFAIIFAVTAKDESNREELRKAREETLTNIQRATAAHEREHRCWEENQRLRKSFEKQN